MQVAGQLLLSVACCVEEVDASMMFAVSNVARTSIMNGSHGRVRYVVTRRMIHALCEVKSEGLIGVRHL